MNFNIYTESHPFALKRTIKEFGLKYAYWRMRDLGLSRRQTIRALFFAI